MLQSQVGRCPSAAPGVGMRTRFARRVCVVVVSIGALLSSTALPSTAAPGPIGTADRDRPGRSDGGRLHGKIVKMLRHMTLREKVGQLFVVEVYGQAADTVTPAMAA